MYWSNTQYLYCTVTNSCWAGLVDCCVVRLRDYQRGILSYPSTTEVIPALRVDAAYRIQVCSKKQDPYRATAYFNFESANPSE